MKRGERRPAQRERRVLVVDDEPDIRELLELTLAKMGLDVVAVGSLAEARATLRAAPLDQVRQLIGKLARTQAPVHVSGESGSGKELAARLIHGEGARRERPFVPVNCGAIPETLMESEFFGYKRGAFTGAEHDRDGFFQAANGGTLFLDEVADLPLAMQVKLLRAIQEKRVRKVGATQEEPVDVRLISATHQNLARLVESGRFRQDLFYRLNVIELTMPPLRDCREDIPLIAASILGALAGGAEIAAADLMLRAVAAEEGGGAAAEGALGAPLPEYLDRVEREAILEALARTQFNRTAAAKLLGITFRTLRYRMQRLGITDENRP